MQKIIENSIVNMKVKCIWKRLCYKQYVIANTLQRETCYGNMCQDTCCKNIFYLVNFLIEFLNSTYQYLLGCEINSVN